MRIYVPTVWPQKQKTRNEERVFVGSALTLIYTVKYDNHAQQHGISRSESQHGAPRTGEVRRRFHEHAGQQAQDSAARELPLRARTAYPMHIANELHLPYLWRSLTAMTDKIDKTSDTFGRLLGAQDELIEAALEQEESSMKRNRAMFTSLRDRYQTPVELYAALDAEFHFDFDPCPLDGKVDGRAPLFSDWKGKRVYCNPPYGNQIPKFLSRWREPEIAVFLIPARVDTQWFHEICLPHASEIRFIRGRLRFEGEKWSAPFPTMLVIFRNERGDDGTR